MQKLTHSSRVSAEFVLFFGSKAAFSWDVDKFSLKYTGKVLPPGVTKQ